MTDANIITSKEFTIPQGLNSNSYFKSSEFLRRTNHFNSAKIEKQLFNINPLYALTRGYIIAHTKSHKNKPFIEAIQIDIPNDWYKGMFNREVARKHLQDFIDFGLLVKPNGRKSIYYVNPLMSHYLSVEQREEYGKNYQDLFPLINIS